MAKVLVLNAAATVGAVFALNGRSDYTVAALRDTGNGVVLEAKFVDDAAAAPWLFVNEWYGDRLVEIDYRASLQYRFRSNTAGPTVRLEAPSGVRIITPAPTS